MSEVDSFISKFSGLTEEYKFYHGTITLRYDPKDHVYLLLTPSGTLEPQDGVTSVVHIIDKSLPLINWAVKMMAQKLKVLLQDHIQESLGRYVVATEIMDDMINDAKSAHRDKLEDAGEIGHIAHAWIESYIKAVLAKDTAKIEEILANLPLDERAKSACIAALDWMHAHNVRWLGTERKIYSRAYKYAGTMDGLCRADSCNDPKCCRLSFKDRLTIADWKTSNYLYIEYILQTGAYKQAYQEETEESVDDIWIIRLGKDNAEFEAWHIDDELAECGWHAFKLALGLSRELASIEMQVAEIKDYRKQLERQARAVEREAALKIKCKGADKYKGIRAPRCNGGNPCQTCLEKYKQKHETLEKVLDKVE